MKVFKDIPYRNQVTLNKELERLSSLLYLISKDIVQSFLLIDYSKNVEELGINDKGEFLNDDQYVSNEISAMEENLRTFFEISDFFKTCIDAFTIIQRNLRSKSFHKEKFLQIVDASFNARLIINDFTETYKILELALIEKEKKEKEIEKFKHNSKMNSDTRNKLTQIRFNTAQNISDDRQLLDKRIQIHTVGELRKSISKSLKRLFPYLLNKSKNELFK